MEEKVYCILGLAVHHPEKAGRTLKAGTAAEALEERADTGLLARHGWLVLHFYAAQSHQPKGRTVHNGLGPPNINPKKIIHRLAPQANLMKAVSQLRFPSSREILACVKVA